MCLLLPKARLSTVLSVYCAPLGEQKRIRACLSQILVFSLSSPKTTDWPPLPVCRLSMPTPDPFTQKVPSFIYGTSQGFLRCSSPFVHHAVLNPSVAVALDSSRFDQRLLACLGEERTINALRPSSVVRRPCLFLSRRKGLGGETLHDPVYVCFSRIACEAW